MIDELLLIRNKHFEDRIDRLDKIMASVKVNAKQSSSSEK